MTKKIIVLLRNLFLLLAAIACGTVGYSETLDKPEEITVPEVTVSRRFSIPDNEAMTLMREIRCGWNLGNTFDAYNGYQQHVSGTSMETSWVQAKTTEGLIQAVKDAGFNMIRIPVSWHNHVDENDTIDEAWINRVREVAGWALDRGMYVIVNVHHDNHKRFFYPDNEHYERSAAYLTSVWTQMANTFQDCDTHLILESMNEPRLTETGYEWNWNRSSAECREAADCINRLNQLFVDTVRATGGKNADRYLMVPAYDAAPWYASDAAFRLPEDPAENRIIVETHAYSPYNFALNTQSPDNTFDLEKDAGKKSEIDGFLSELYRRFVSKGIPVIMDEFGALNKSGNTQARVNYTAYYVAAAAARGIPCVWWDNHVFTGNGEQFGLISRKTLNWIYPEIVEAIQKNSMKRPETEQNPTTESVSTDQAETIPSLKEIYADRFDFGAAAPQAVFRDIQMMRLMKDQFSILTPENELKPDSVLDVAGSKKLVRESGDEKSAAVHFDAAKALLRFAQSNGIKVHGHVLVWHSQTPEAFFHESYDLNQPLVSREIMLGRLENYIRGIMEYMETNYPGVIVSWDVLNEAIDDGSNWLRNSNWMKTIGEDYPNRAFELARKYAPEGTLLYYNDYNTAYPNKLKGILKLLYSLIPEGNIDGYGFQMHHSVGTPTNAQIRSCVEAVARTGLKLRVSELDIGVDNNSDSSFQKQAEKYAFVMKVLIEHSDQFEAVQVWGLTDRMSWRSRNYPLLLDGGGNPKPAFWAVADPDSY